MLPIPPNTFVGHEVLASWSMKYPPAAKAKQQKSEEYSSKGYGISVSLLYFYRFVSSFYIALLLLHKVHYLSNKVCTFLL